MQKHSLLVGLCLLVNVCSCSKKDPEPATRTQLLVDKKWQLRSAVFSFPGAQDVEYYNLVRLCSKDDYQQFILPNKLVRDEGLTKCSNNNPQTTTGTWELSNNDTKLITTDQNVVNSYTLLKLTSDSLKFSLTETQPIGIDATTTFLYTTVK